MTRDELRVMRSVRWAEGRREGLRDGIRGCVIQDEGLRDGIRGCVIWEKGRRDEMRDSAMG